MNLGILIPRTPFCGGGRGWAHQPHDMDILRRKSQVHSGSQDSPGTGPIYLPNCTSGHSMQTSAFFTRALLSGPLGLCTCPSSWDTLSLLLIWLPPPHPSGLRLSPFPSQTGLGAPVWCSCNYPWTAQPHFMVLTQITLSPVLGNVQHVVGPLEIYID